MLTVRLAVGFWDVLGPFDLEKAFDRAAVEVSSGAVWVPLPRLEILAGFFLLHADVRKNIRLAYG